MKTKAVLFVFLLFVLVGAANAQKQSKLDKLISEVDAIYVPQMEAIAGVQSGGCMEGAAFLVEKKPGLFSGLGGGSLSAQIDQQMAALGATHWTLVDVNTSGTAAQIVPLVCIEPDEPQSETEFVYLLVFTLQNGTETGYEPYTERSVCETDGQALVSAREQYQSYGCSATRLHTESALPELGIEG